MERSPLLRQVPALEVVSVNMIATSRLQRAGDERFRYSIQWAGDAVAADQCRCDGPSIRAGFAGLHRVRWLRRTIPAVTSALGMVTPQQRALLRQWLPNASVERDHSWGLVGTTVLEMTQAGSRFIVKAGGANDHHIERELHAHLHWLSPWTSRGRAPTLLHGSAEAKLLVTAYLPGELVLGSEHAGDPAIFRQAGELLALLHAQTAITDDDYERRENEKSLALLSGPHRIAAATVERLRAEISSWPTSAASVVPTHGDWQPRNWLVHEDVVSVIDFGRAATRPAFTDFTRLAAQQFHGDADLETAFLDGYGIDPRETNGWHRNRIREAIGTAAWAYQVGNEPFEAQGHQMIAEALSEFSA
jgi:thiamine kinase-like enzyme